MDHGQQEVDTVLPINISGCQHWTCNFSGRLLCLGFSIVAVFRSSFSFSSGRKTPNDQITWIIWEQRGTSNLPVKWRPHQNKLHFLCVIQIQKSTKLTEK